MRRFLYLIVVMAAVAASPVSAAWREAKSQHFVIYSEQSAESLQQFAEGLERYDKGLRLLFGVSDPKASHASRVLVFVVPNAAAVRRLMGPNTPAGVNGFYRNWPAGPAAFVPRSTGRGEEFGMDSTTVLQHEYAHHFLLQNFSSVFPAWFNEGFAEFAATAERQRDGSVSFGLPAQHRAYSLLQESPLPIEKLLGSPPNRANEREISSFYARGWLLCHYLMVDATRRAQLLAYFKKLNSGEPNLDAARSAFGDLAKLNRDLDAYLNQIRSRMTSFRLPASALPIDKVAIRELGPGETAMIDVRMRSRAGVNPRTASEVVAMARKAAAPFPDDPAVLTALAEAEFDAGNFAAAEAAADKAIAADPKAIDALTYKGAARMALTTAAGKKDPASWTEVRKWFLAANRLDPDDPEPLALFFRSYLEQGIEPTDNALQGALQAMELAPQNITLRMNVVRRLLRLGKAAEARNALLRVASEPHGGELRDAAARAIAALDSGGTAAAMKILMDFRQTRPAGADPAAGDKS